MKKKRRKTGALVPPWQIAATFYLAIVLHEAESLQFSVCCWICRLNCFSGVSGGPDIGVVGPPTSIIARRSFLPAAGHKAQ